MLDILNYVKDLTLILFYATLCSLLLKIIIEVGIIETLKKIIITNEIKKELNNKK